MDAKPKQILIYQTEDGRTPFSKWMEAVADLPIYDVVMTRLDRVERGNFGDHKSVGEGVQELIINFGPGYRVYFGQDGADLVILLIGGDKRTQPTDIRTAKEYWRNYNA